MLSKSLKTNQRCNGDEKHQILKLNTPKRAARYNLIGSSCNDVWDSVLGVLFWILLHIMNGFGHVCIQLLFVLTLRVRINEFQ